jgi:peptide/nickel transport system permease protein
MVRYLIARFANAVVTLLAVVTLVFFLIRLSGDPAALLLPPNAPLSEIARLRTQLGLDRPLWVQYASFMRGVLARGDFGQSFRLNAPAFGLVADRIPPTAELTAVALAVAVGAGVPLGIAAGLRPGGWGDVAGQTVAVLGQSVPTFWFGILLLLLFAVRFGWFPVMGIGGLSHLMLPAVTLGAPTAALLSRMLRSSILDIVHEDYVRTARAKGFSERAVMLRHVVRNAIIPAATALGLNMGVLMGGAVVTETVFSYPGMGLLTIQAIYGRDYPIVQAFVVIAAAVITCFNLLTDVAYVVIDPRIRFR